MLKKILLLACIFQFTLIKIEAQTIYEMIASSYYSWSADTTTPVDSDIYTYNSAGAQTGNLQLIFNGSTWDTGYNSIEYPDIFLQLGNINLFLQAKSFPVVLRNIGRTGSLHKNTLL